MAILFFNTIYGHSLEIQFPMSIYVHLLTVETHLVAILLFNATAPYSNFTVQSLFGHVALTSRYLVHTCTRYIYAHSTHTYTVHVYTWHTHVHGTRRRYIYTNTWYIHVHGTHTFTVHVYGTHMMLSFNLHIYIYTSALYVLMYVHIHDKR